MAFKSNSNLMGGQTSFLLFVTIFCFIVAVAMIKLPPGFGEAIVVGRIVFMATFMSTEAGLYLLICSMLLSPEFGGGGLEGGDTTSSRGVTIRGEDVLLVLLGFAWLIRTAVHKDLGLIRPTPLNAPIGIYIGITNAINFLDGMDGLCTGFCCIVSVFFGLVALQNQQDYMVYLALPLVGACLGFLPYNFRPFRPAAIFLGDAGSTFLGFTVAALGVMGDWAGDHAVRLIVPILVLGVPIFDMSFTTFMRIKSGQVRSFKQWIDYTGRDHIHHRIADLRIGRSKTVLVIYIVTIWLGLSALALENATGLNAVLQVAQSVIVFLLMGSFMVFVQHKYEEIEHKYEEIEQDNQTGEAWRGAE